MTNSDSTIPAHLAQARLTINLAAIAGNWRRLKEIAGPAECAAVVKADAYGTGIERVAPALAKAGCRTFFVAHASEAITLRGLLPDAATLIYTLNGLAGGAANVDALVQHAIRPVLCSMEDLDLWLENCGPDAMTCGVGLHFSTGMNRLGFSPAHAADVAARFTGHRAPPINFIMSHFVSSEIADDRINSRQIEAFAEIRGQFPGITASLANSSGIFLPEKPFYDLVRPGYALYGGNPTPGQPNPMRPVVGLTAPVLQVRTAEKGETAGYNGVWKAGRRSRLAIVGIGYADGIPRAAGGPDNPGHAILGGIPCPIAGRISMDLLILDVTDAPQDKVYPGAIAEVLGPSISVDDIAEKAGTIGYEILTGLGRRYHRHYVSAD